jgi:hypothetical protein
VFKNAVYPLTEEEFEKNSFQLADIFANDSLVEFNNNSAWNVTKTPGPLVGNCFTTSYMTPVKSFQVEVKLHLKKNLDYTVYVHNPGLHSIIEI